MHNLLRSNGTASTDPNARDFTTAKPNRFWGSDVRTRAGFLDLAIVRDAFSHRIVGRAMAWI
jgi:hypothetical protein